MTFALISIIIMAIGGVLYRVRFLWIAAAEPKALRGMVCARTIEVGGRERSYLQYRPAQAAERPSVVVVLHGSLQDARRIRTWTGFGFDRLADEHGFVTVYPNGLSGNWNECRRHGPSLARRDGINDVAFILAVIERVCGDCCGDPARVFVAGYSSGGHMAFRLAFEASGKIAAVAAIAAGLPTADNLTVAMPPQQVATLIMNGTADRINPDQGGEVTLFGFQSRGTVLSSIASAEMLAARAGHRGKPAVSTLAGDGSAPCSVERHLWSTPGHAEIELYRIIGGGHAVPQPYVRAPFIVGRTCAVDGPKLVWNFFARQPETGTAGRSRPRAAHV